jgi:single-strand DNA-binding protein
VLCLIRTKLISTNLAVSFAALCIIEIIYPLGVNLMLVTLSGRTGRAVETNDVERHDGSGSFQITETSLAVNVTKDTADWYKLRFTGDSLVTAASYIAKGVILSVTGTLTFEHWTDEDGVLRSKPVVAVSEVQLPTKVAVAV